MVGVQETRFTVHIHVQNTELYLQNEGICLLNPTNHKSPIGNLITIENS